MRLYPGCVWCVALALVGGPHVMGCKPSNVPQPRVIEVQYQPLDVVRSQLERYAAGQALDSERELFSMWVTDVRATDPETADMLATGFAEIESKPAQARVIAKKLLDKLP